MAGQTICDRLIGECFSLIVHPKTVVNRQRHRCRRPRQNMQPSPVSSDDAALAPIHCRYDHKTFPSIEPAVFATELTIQAFHHCHLTLNVPYKLHLLESVHPDVSYYSYTRKLLKTWHPKNIPVSTRQPRRKIFRYINITIHAGTDCSLTFCSSPPPLLDFLRQTDDVLPFLSISRT